MHGLLDSSNSLALKVQEIKGSYEFPEIWLAKLIETFIPLLTAPVHV